MANVQLNHVPPPSPVPARSPDSLTSAALLQNALWFTNIRWIVIAAFVALSSLVQLIGPEPLQLAGIRKPDLWPWIIAAVLTVLNIVSIKWLQRLSPQTHWHGISTNIWTQIVSDLAILSVIVYMTGATDTVIAYGFLFHVTLACIFFGRRDSLIVTLLSAFLYLSIVILECAGWLPYRSLLSTTTTIRADWHSSMMFALPTVFVWFITWHLTSFISTALRERDRNLEEANQQLRLAEAATNRSVLRVTHDLKAPFVGIESNIQVLKSSHWAEIPEAARQIIDRIDARSTVLRTRIGAILTLGDLRSTAHDKHHHHTVMLSAALESARHNVQDLATQKNVSIHMPTEDAGVSTEERQLRILLSNLLSNAVTYSNNGGSVEVTITQTPAAVCVQIADHGIGISENALPHIFDDFYRSQEAAAFNPNSTGLGLAIARQIARNLHLSINVESESGKGTVFQILIPRHNEPRETTHGTHHHH